MRQHITIKDIARIAGVSTSTVSRALSNSPELSEQTRQRILEICRQEGYRVNALARSLICNKTNVIGLIVPEVTNPFYAELSLGIETHARSLGYNVILCNGQNDTKVTEELFGFLISHQVDGIILASSQQDAGTMIQNFAPRLPTVLLGTPALVSGDEVNSVCIDNLAGGRLAAEHLLELGHRDIVYLGNRPNSLTHQLRLRGFTETLEKAGITPQVIDNPHGCSSIDIGCALSRELFAVADENGGKLKNRVVLFCDEFGTMPPFDILPLFSAGRSRRLTLVPIIQSLAQLEKNYGKEGCEIIQDNCQDTIFGGFAPNSQTAEVLSKALGSRTVLSGSVSRGKNDPSQSLQMMERALLTPDELKSIPKGSFIVMKTGTHPMRTRLQLFLNWGITFGEPYTVPERANRAVAYANRVDLERNLPKSDKSVEAEEYRGYAVAGHGGMVQTPAQEKSHKYGKGMKTFEKEEL